MTPPALDKVVRWALFKKDVPLKGYLNWPPISWAGGLPKHNLPATTPRPNANMDACADKMYPLTEETASTVLVSVTEIMMKAMDTEFKYQARTDWYCDAVN